MTVRREDTTFRRHVRVPGFDYRSCRAYFVTICVSHRACVFGEVIDDTVRLTQRGQIAHDCWLSIPAHHPHVELDAFEIMPNHLHGILRFEGDAPGLSPPPVLATPASRPPLAAGPLRGSLGAVIGSFKSAVTRNINKVRPGAASGLWQENYYEHVVRNDRSFDRIRSYILTNPLRWARDAYNPDGDGSDDFEQFVIELVTEDDSPLRGDATQASPVQGEGGERDG